MLTGQRVINMKFLNLLALITIPLSVSAGPFGNFGFLNKKINKSPVDYNFVGKSLNGSVLTSDNIDFYATGINDAHQLCLGYNLIAYSYKKLTRANIKAFEGTGSNSCIIDSSDNVQCCGKNSKGESALGNFNNYTPGNNWFMTSLSNVAFLTGYDGGTPEGGFLAIKSDGSVHVWGLNDTGRFLTGNTTNINSPLQIVGPGSGYIQGALSSSGICLRTGTGKVFCAGSNDNGQLGDGTLTSRNTFAEVLDLSPHNIVDIKAGGAHFCAKTSTNDLYCWGYNNAGQIGNGSSLPVSTPFLVTSGITDFSMGKEFTMYQKGGDVYFSGNNSNGQFGMGNTSNSNTTFVKNNRLDPGSVEFSYAGANFSCVKLLDKKIKCAGQNGVGQLGNGSQRQYSYFKEIAYP